jgi:hypothetical protein
MHAVHCSLRAYRVWQQSAQQPDHVTPTSKTARQPPADASTCMHACMYPDTHVHIRPSYNDNAVVDQPSPAAHLPHVSSLSVPLACTYTDKHAHVQPLLHHNNPTQPSRTPCLFSPAACLSSLPVPLVNDLHARTQISRHTYNLKDTSLF